MNDPRAELLAALDPVLPACADLLAGPIVADERAVKAALEARFPADGPVARRIADALRAGVAAGVLCDRGEPPARFGRVAKPSPETSDLSIDVVWLTGAGLRHAHPRGEITFGIADEASCAETVRFDGAPPGWHVRAPGSVHTPEVTGGGMILLYVLPGGAIDWQPGG
ncbi:MAG: DUF4863 family protein [Deltaproteobacteria bacterium]|nr:MAG: DUF4863 family protein [Deltaproteobacteria bacterium]